MKIHNVGDLKELIQGLDDDISIEVDHGGAYYDIDEGLLLFNQGVDNETLLGLTLTFNNAPF
ncbi:hypothetical protein N9112_00480 [bacterium]|nr:hypothetical protein [bacterium]